MNAFFIICFLFKRFPFHFCLCNIAFFMHPHFPHWITLYQQQTSIVISSFINMLKSRFLWIFPVTFLLLWRWSIFYSFSSVLNTESAESTSHCDCLIVCLVGGFFSVVFGWIFKTSGKSDFSIKARFILPGVHIHCIVFRFSCGFNQFGHYVS